MMLLNEAELYAERVCRVLNDNMLTSRFEVVGSIRRERPVINDIDIIATPRSVEYWTQIPKALYTKMRASIVKRGKELITVLIPDESSTQYERTSFRTMQGMIQVDLYRARPETWGVLELIRTGSKEHNVKLCAHAMMNHMMLSAAKGVIKDGNVIASKTEEDIFNALGLPFVKPEDREVQT